MLRNTKILRSIGAKFLPFALFALFGIGTALAFDTAGYQAADLDKLAARKPALGLGTDIASAQRIQFEVVLASLPEACPTKYLKWAMRKSGIAKDAVDSTPITQCIKVKSPKGRSYLVFVQDALAEPLAKEVKQDDKLTLYGALIYFAQRGPGIVVNDFNAAGATAPQPHSSVDLGLVKKK